MFSPIRLLALALLLGTAACDSGRRAPPAAEATPPLAGARIGGPFALIDKNGNTVRDTDFAGKYRIVYFGFTFCPDACPMDVQRIVRGYAAFEKAHPDRAALVQPIFISIDPARDTPQAVGQFAAAFHPRLIGLTGSEAQVAAAARGYAAYYARRDGGDAEHYLVDHSRVAYLMGPQGEPIAMLPIDQGADAVAAELARWVR